MLHQLVLSRLRDVTPALAHISTARAQPVAAASPVYRKQPQIEEFKLSQVNWKRHGTLINNLQVCTPWRSTGCHERKPEMKGASIALTTQREACAGMWQGQRLQHRMAHAGELSLHSPATPFTASRNNKTASTKQSQSDDEMRYRIFVLGTMVGIAIDQTIGVASRLADTRAHHDRPEA